MTQKIIDGISKKLFEEFGDGYTIYTESIKQDLKTPCFFIQLINPSNEKKIGRRFLRNNLFCIQYFPKYQNASKAECIDVLDKLNVDLEYIKIDGELQRGVGMHGEFTDGIISFFVEYNMFVIEKRESVTMETLENLSMKMKG